MFFPRARRETRPGRRGELATGQPGNELIHPTADHSKRPSLMLKGQVDAAALLAPMIRQRRRFQRRCAGNLSRQGLELVSLGGIRSSGS